MNDRRPGFLPAAFAAALMLPSAAFAITVDGQRDPSYQFLGVQTVQTSSHFDPSMGVIDYSNGSELDAAWAAVDGTTLYLFLAGNLRDIICNAAPCTAAGAVNVFFDTQPGGQNPLVSASPDIYYPGWPGLTFDSGFTPDFWIDYAVDGALDFEFRRSSAYASLPAGGGGVSYSLGTSYNAGAPGTFAGTNPFGIEGTSDNRNTAGVTQGCAAASGAGVTTGIELAIPLAAIGNPVDCFRISVIVVESTTAMLNQVLPPVPVGTCTLGTPSGVNFESIPGLQYYTICPAAVPVRASTWGALKSIYR